jgi:DNA processing protein
MLDTTLSDISTRSATGLLMLGAIKGVGRVAVTKLVDRFETIGECLRADEESLKACLNVKQRAAFRDPAVIDRAYRQAFKEVARAQEINATILSLYDEGYPERLKDLDEPPFVLYAAGDLAILERSVGFVGTREPTDFGAKVAYGMSSAFAADGFCIVSGLARGIDAISHNAAVEAGGTTCAVLASGLDRYSSAAAMELAKRIVEGGGLLITECGFGQEPTQGSYIDRDRLITGLSLATVFVQGETMSGSMHSVRYALVQDKPIYVPNIPEKFLAEDINHTARNLFRLTAAQFASKCEWKGSVMEAVARRADVPVADAIMNRDDYRRVFDEINSLLPHMPSRPVSYADIAATF